MGPPVFPLEIFELIIDSVVGAEALCSCALVCRSWYLRVRRNIFRVVSLYENKYKDTVEDSEGVTRLQLQWKWARVACPFSLIQDASIAWEFAGILVPCASSFTQLRRLKLYSSDVGYRYPGAPEIRSASQLLRALPISHLEISASYFATFQLFLSLWDTSYPSLKDLKISLISIQDMHSRFRSLIIEQASEIMRSYDTIPISEHTMLESLEALGEYALRRCYRRLPLPPKLPHPCRQLKTFKLHSDPITGHGLASIFVPVLPSSLNYLAISCSDDDLRIDAQHLPALMRLTLTVVLTAEALLRVVDIISKVQSTLEHLILRIRQRGRGTSIYIGGRGVCWICVLRSVQHGKWMWRRRWGLAISKVLIPLSAECSNIRILSSRALTIRTTHS